MQTQSQFERMYNGHKVAISFLMIQYRMHYVVSAPHNRFFYKSAVRDGKSAAEFLTAYNQRRVSGRGSYPLTMLDTSYYRRGRETDRGDGKMSNDFESREVRKVTNTLYSLMNDGMKGKIAVIAPYREQMENIRDVLTPQFLMNEDIIFDTVDSMQGAERDVVIFSSIRSNDEGVVGFISNRRRLNVAVSRARRLLVVIGDVEHLYEIPAFKFFIDWCRDEKEGAGKITIQPARSDEIAQPATRG